MGERPHPCCQQHRCCPTLPSYRLRAVPPTPCRSPACSCSVGPPEGDVAKKNWPPKLLGLGGEAGLSGLNLGLSPWGRLALGRCESCLHARLARASCPSLQRPRHPGLAWPQHGDGRGALPSVEQAGVAFLPGHLAPWSQALGRSASMPLRPPQPLRSRACRFSRAVPVPRGLQRLAWDP